MVTTLLGNMMRMPLTITSLMRHAQQVFSEVELVSVNLDQSRHRYRYQDCFQRAAQLAGALTDAGLSPGDRVATLAWNDHYHLEAYYAISCAGAVCHTINPRLHPNQILDIIDNAQDRFLLISADLYSALGSVLSQAKSIEKLIVYQTGNIELSANAVEYEAFIGNQPTEFDWPELDENQACGLCYTSGTTGNPKGALYSHRSTVLHTFAMSLPDSLNISMGDTVMPVVPMFHVNAWGIPYAAPMVGARMVLPGRFMGDGKVLAQLIAEESVTQSAAVPTAWANLLAQLPSKEAGRDILKSLNMAVIGGAAAPKQLVQELESFGPTVRCAWGMTETSPLGCVNRGLDRNNQLEPIDTRLKAGRPVFGTEFRIVNDAGKSLPWDDQSAGHLEIRGHWVCSSYYQQASDNWSNEGWFHTGDVAMIDPEARITITDRSKDLIKSGGEWISSLELENIASQHPSVAEAAVIARPDPKWDERPHLIVTLKPDQQLTEAELLAFFDGKVAKWWIPDSVSVIAEMPHTATGKIDKKVLRQPS